MAGLGQPQESVEKPVFGGHNFPRAVETLLGQQRGNYGGLGGPPVVQRLDLVGVVLVVAGQTASP